MSDKYKAMEEVVGKVEALLSDVPLPLSIVYDTWGSGAVRRVLNDAKGQGFATMVGLRDGRDEKYAQAVVALVNAAPELLAELKELRKHEDPKRIESENRAIESISRRDYDAGYHEGYKDAQHEFGR